MTWTLLLATPAPRSERWTRDVFNPPEFKSEPYHVYSPLLTGRGSLIACDLRLLSRDGRLQLRIDQAAGLQANVAGFVQHNRATVLVPVALAKGRFRCGMRILDEANEEELGLLYPVGSEQGLPDWRDALEPRGLALLSGEARQKDRPSDPDTVYLVTRTVHNEDEDAWNGAAAGWLNPLAFAFSGVPATGLPDQGDKVAGNGTTVQRTIAAATARALLPEPDKAARRRALGWRALARVLDNRVTSPLKQLLCGMPDAPLGGFATERFSDLADLDRLQGTFVASWPDDAPAPVWGWLPPASDGDPVTEASRAERQLQARLLAAVGLPRIDSTALPPPLHGWGTPAPTPPGSFTLLEVEDPEDSVSWLANVANASGLPGGVQPILSRLAGALAEEAKALDPRVAATLLRLLPARPGEGKILIDADNLLESIVSYFIRPQSRVIVKADLPARGEGVDEEDFRKRFSHRSIDLFAAPSYPFETVGALLDAAAATPSGQAIYKEGWLSLFWKHFVAGDAGTRFELFAEQRLFHLDISKLDRAELGP